MNKKTFSELAEKSGMEPDILDENEGIIWWLSNSDLEKFYSLTIQDCLGIMEKYSKANEESDSWVKMVTMMQEETKKHFGVKL